MALARVSAMTVASWRRRVSHAAGRIYAAAPGIGDHNEEIYGGLLGMSGGELEGLVREGVT